MKATLSTSLFLLLISAQSVQAHSGAIWHIHPHAEGFGSLESLVVLVLISALALWLRSEERE